MAAFAELTDVLSLTGKEYTAVEQSRISELLPLISDALRVKAKAAGMDLDAMAEADPAYASTLKIVTVDVTARAMRQSYDGEAMSQESQTALGYTWQGSYAIPGGGIASAIMRSDLKTLGIRRQRVGVLEPYATEVSICD